METVTVQIDARWLKRLHSPLYWVVASLQGVAATFAPLFLYWSGQGILGRHYDWIIVPACLASIWIVMFFYLRLGGAVMTELSKK